MDEIEQKRIFDQWVKEHKGILFKIVRAYAFTPDDQDDLFQEISLQLWKSIPDFRGESKVSTWIYRVALYSAYVWVRSEKKRPETQPLADVERTLVMKEQEKDGRLNWLYDQIGQLDPLDRSVCLLLLDGFKYREIAEVLGISESNVGIKIHRIKQHLTRKSQELDYYG
ncbi:MAG: RNA polymerase sigma factor, partial [Candidatus Promineifilaceae bacterium]